MEHAGDYPAQGLLAAQFAQILVEEEGDHGGKQQIQDDEPDPHFRLSFWLKVAILAALQKLIFSYLTGKIAQ